MLFSKPWTNDAKIAISLPIPVAITLRLDRILGVEDSR